MGWFWWGSWLGRQRLRCCCLGQLVVTLGAGCITLGDWWVIWFLWRAGQTSLEDVCKLLQSLESGIANVQMWRSWLWVLECMCKLLSYNDGSIHSRGCRHSAVVREEFNYITNVFCLCCGFIDVIALVII